MIIPEDLAPFALGQGGPGRMWLERLPSLVAECAERWSLRLIRPLPTRHSLVAEVARADGSLALLQLTYPEPEGAQEAEGLRHWSGDGAVLVLEADPARSAMLLERLVSGP
ncbi:MAG: aminoglycoside phosphotransferase family protein [Thermoleophilaceae bacterium]